MSKVCTIGLDIAKNKFQAHGEDQEGHKVLGKQLLRKNVLELFANLPPCLVGIEACAGAHYWARKLNELGHDARLIPTRQVKPFVINNKTDAADARAICEVVRRPNTTFVSVKSIYQQQVMALHKMRERLISNRTSLVNQALGFFLEVGLAIPQGIQWIRTELQRLIDDNDSRLTSSFKIIFSLLYNELTQIDDKIKNIEKEIMNLVKENEIYNKIMKIQGVGFITASAIVGFMGTAKQFKNGRTFAACLGLTPREYSSGGKQRLLGISKRGNNYLRKLLIEGARSIFGIWSTKKI